MSVSNMDKPIFQLVRYNPRRAQRGAEAAEVKVTWPEGHVETLWMNKGDILANIYEFGDASGLLDALNAYKQNKSFPDRQEVAICLTN